MRPLDFAMSLQERDRLRELRRYEILDTPPEEPFETLVWLASRIYKQPIAFISFVDGTRQWLKASIGLRYSAAPRELSFCAHTILSGDLLVVADASKDLRFRASPQVLHSPHIHFYAAAPLVTPSGYNIGTVGVASRHSGHMDRTGREILLQLARLTMDELELRLSIRRLLNGTVQHALDQTELDHARADLDRARRAAVFDHGTQLACFAPSPGSFIRSLF